MQSGERIVFILYYCPIFLITSNFCMYIKLPVLSHSDQKRFWSITAANTRKINPLNAASVPRYFLHLTSTWYISEKKKINKYWFVFSEFPGLPTCWRFAEPHDCPFGRLSFFLRQCSELSQSKFPLLYKYFLTNEVFKSIFDLSALQTEIWC